MNPKFRSQFFWPNFKKLGPKTRAWLEYDQQADFWTDMIHYGPNYGIA